MPHSCCRQKLLKQKVLKQNPAPVIQTGKPNYYILKVPPCPFLDKARHTVLLLSEQCTSLLNFLFLIKISEVQRLPADVCFWRIHLLPSSLQLSFLYPAGEAQKKL